MSENRSSLVYGETVVISDLIAANFSSESKLKPFYAEQYRICPGCSGIMRFVKKSSDDEDYTAHSILYRWSLVGDDIEETGDFSGHVASCLEKLHTDYGLSNPFEDGFINLNPDSLEHEIRLIDFMSTLSQKATGFPKQATRSFIENAECFPYLFVENNVPVGYCSITERFAYSKGDFWCFEPDDMDRIENLDEQLYPGEEGVPQEVGNQCIISDIYTFDNFRSRGNATKILNYVINECKMDTDNLLVSAPLSKFSKGIFSSASTNRIVCVHFQEGTGMAQGISYLSEEIPEGQIKENYLD